MLQNIADQTRLLHELHGEGYTIRAQDLAFLRPYLTRNLKRFGEYDIQYKTEPASERKRTTDLSYPQGWTIFTRTFSLRSHGLRAAEVVALRWHQIDLDQGVLHVRRLKNGIPSVHPLRGPEIRALRQFKRETGPSAYVFTTERGGPMTTSGFRKMLSRCGEISDRAFRIHPHMVRHVCGYKLANDGQDTRTIQHYLGHKNIRHTVCFTELSSNRFKEF